MMNRNQKNHTREMHGRTKCPCESGRTYAQCCKQTDLKWCVDDNGMVLKKIPLTDEPIKLLQQAEEHFFQVFERKPHKNDPVFLAKYLLSDVDMQREMVRVMEKAEIAPEFIYAYQKTGGLLLTEENEKLATGKDLEDWNNAIDEYFSGVSKKLSKLEILFQSFTEEIFACIICIGYILENEILKSAIKEKSSSKFFTVDDYVLLHVTQTANTLRAIDVLLNERMSDNSLPLVRHIYENYIHIIFALNCPDQLINLIDVPLGLSQGLYAYGKNNKGDEDRRVIIRKSDGKKFKGHISNYLMLNSSKYKEDTLLFNFLYKFLSDYTHPSLNSLSLRVDKDGQIDHLKNSLEEEARFYSICFSGMVLDQMRSLNCVSKRAKRDIVVIVRRIASKANELLDALYANEKPEHISILQIRMSKLGY
ncbi:SEC-C domain-containing protein [Acinetobacter baumannii]|nr:SEC-C domain-containing protein [Acinetobacter baumannii]MDC5382084.1 SEC-C domain-containing protein [Acinetobacter baumannii]MDC5522948.1 SEC-C domain-containing protein [Acinetobacter baumannii]MDC5637894.1 SEC-C domain-containing protein [Acinetobacter baumannii]MDC5673440.1 SEC-C domain-containing protein [Acinetobacter baumannii]